jgi:hypothetical protein
MTNLRSVPATPDRYKAVSEIQRGPAVGYAPLAPIWSCTVCGALVMNTELHDQFHNRFREARR